jgi:hypothetical protein
MVSHEHLRQQSSRHSDPVESCQPPSGLQHQGSRSRRAAVKAAASTFQTFQRLTSYFPSSASSVLSPSEGQKPLRAAPRGASGCASVNDSQKLDGRSSRPHIARLSQWTPFVGCQSSPTRVQGQLAPDFFCGWEREYSSRRHLRQMLHIRLPTALERVAARLRHGLKGPAPLGIGSRSRIRCERAKGGGDVR